MNAEEVHNKLEPRLRKVEGFRSWIKGAITLGGAAFLGLGGHVLYTFFVLNKDVAVHENRLSATERNHAKLEAELRTKYDMLSNAQDQLRRNVVVLWDRQTKGPPHLVEALVFHGRIESVSPKQISILPKEIGEPVYQFSLPENVPVRVKGKPAKIGDLEIGMNASVLVTGGKLASIESD